MYGQAIISHLKYAKLKFIVWSEWGDTKNQRYLTGYFSVYDLICCSMVLFPMAFGSALFIHLLQAGVYA